MGIGDRPGTANSPESPVRRTVGTAGRFTASPVPVLTYIRVRMNRQLVPNSSSDLAARQFRVTIASLVPGRHLKRPKIGPFGKVGTGLSVKSELATHFRRFSGHPQPRRAAFFPDRDNNFGTPFRVPRKCRKARFSGGSSRYVVRLARYIPAPSRTGNYCRVTAVPSLMAQFRKLRLFDIIELAFAARMILMPPPSRARSAASRRRQLRKGLAGLAERNRRTSGRSGQCVRETKAQASPGQSPRW